jgi:threonine synthase
MVSVQAEGCAPVIRAFEQGAAACEFWKDAHTIASGLRVPKSFADHLILQGVYESHGTAIAVSDEAILTAQKQLARHEGIFAAPEGAATLAALQLLVEQNWVLPGEKIVLFNTGSGLKYLDPSSRAA